jgi:hypothetical protein
MLLGININMECIFCLRNINNKGSLFAHQKVCSNNPNRIKYKRSPKAGRQKGCIAWNKGKNNIELYGVKKAYELKEKSSAAIKKSFAENGSTWSKMTKKQQHAFREAHRIAINKRYEDGWLPKAGRCKKIVFKSLYAGTVTVDGSWELELANYLEKNKIKWLRNKERFLYINEKGSKSYYTPDFYLIDYNIFIEVKGYETEKDRCKWKHFTKKLNVFKINEIKKIKNNECFDNILKESKLVGN